MSAPELRIDQLTGLRTILAPGRAERPEAFAPAPASEPGRRDCPFCEGREDRTPPEIVGDRARRAASRTRPGWRARVGAQPLPGAAPAATRPRGGAGEASGPPARADPLRASRAGGEPDLFASRPATGAHEVIIHTPEHVTSLAELDEESSPPRSAPGASGCARTPTPPTSS